MKRTSISLPDDLATLVQHEADRSATSVSEVIRDAIAKTFLGRARKIPFAGICDDPKMTRAARLDEALEGWIDDIDRDRG
ncbi:MAG: CopG family transcriptional regulator [Acidobacteria bacterium]|nr:CopG family transcriptional regulator [Acidobacteriota bacterium]MBV9067710.1 CopG family transcriptional regulator [Acidobacteriota bacterium]MBV9185767.1 CopG family transcriptional regulator [Acidobacteriota bacterium]